MAGELDADEPDRFLRYRALCVLARSPLHPGQAQESLDALGEARRIEDRGWPAGRLLHRARAEAYVASLAGDVKEALYRKRQVLSLAQACGSDTSQDVCDLIDTELAAGNVAAAARFGSALVASLGDTRDQPSLAYAQLNRIRC